MMLDIFGLWKVRHRIDGLENLNHTNSKFVDVRHRIDGLETNSLELQLHRIVRHRIDGLESHRKFL